MIGLTTYYDDARWSSWSRAAALLPAPYFELVAAAGGRPVLVPPVRNGPGGPAAGSTEVVSVLDGLVISGGGDLDPTWYGAEAHPESDPPDRCRDRSEASLLDAALHADLPVLAICRGMQVLNVGRGGSLHQHLPSVTGDLAHRPRRGEFGDVKVTTVAGTRVAELMGEVAEVRCSHHQAVDRVGQGLVVSAWAQDAGSGAGSVVEALEMPDRRFVLGVQWHPEEAGDRRLFAALVGAT